MTSDDLNDPPEDTKQLAARALRDRFVRAVEDEGCSLNQAHLRGRFATHFAFFEMPGRWEKYQSSRALRRHTRRCMQRAAELAAAHAAAREEDPCVVDERDMQHAHNEIDMFLRIVADKTKQPAGSSLGLAC